MSHANGDLDVVDMLLVQLQLGCGGTAVPCLFSASFHGNCTLYLHQGGLMGFRCSPQKRALESKLQPRVSKKSFWDKMLKINHMGGAVWPKKSWKWVLGLCVDP